jgi:hypothetical protein
MESHSFLNSIHVAQKIAGFKRRTHHEIEGFFSTTRRGIWRTTFGGCGGCPTVATHSS